MRTIIKEVHYCDHCSKSYLRKDSCAKHEVICHKNPENKRKCLSCNNLTKKEATIYYDTYGGESKRTVELFYCNVIKSFLYPPKVEIKNNAFEMGDESNQPMLKECESFLTENHFDLDTFFD